MFYVFSAFVFNAIYDLVSAEIKGEYSFTSPPLYTFMAWC
jgi:cell shape-determining protein MreD